MYVPALEAGSSIPYSNVRAAAERFFSLGSPHGNRGLTRTAYLSKPQIAEETLVLDELTHVSGYCSYAFLITPSKHTVGFIVVSPTDITHVDPYSLSIGKRSDEFRSRNDLLPQGVSLFDSVEGFVVFASSAVSSPLLVAAE